MRHTPNVTDVEGILIGHYALRKRLTGCTVIAARKPFVALLVWIMTISMNVFGQTKEPCIYFENTRADFGSVTQGKVIKQVFPFANRGSGTLEILAVSPS